MVSASLQWSISAARCGVGKISTMVGTGGDTREGRITALPRPVSVDVAQSEPVLARLFTGSIQRYGRSRPTRHTRSASAPGVFLVRRASRGLRRIGTKRAAIWGRYSLPPEAIVEGVVLDKDRVARKLGFPSRVNPDGRAAAHRKRLPLDHRLEWPAAVPLAAVHRPAGRAGHDLLGRLRISGRGVVSPCKATEASGRGSSTPQALGGASRKSAGPLLLRRPEHLAEGARPEAVDRCLPHPSERASSLARRCRLGRPASVSGVPTGG
jgi:hypothetical protein